MANADTPRGFWPIRHLTGGQVRMQEFPIATGYNTDIFRGDAVKLVTGGGIEAAAAGNRIVGVFQGVQYVAADGTQVYSKYWPNTTTATDIKATVWSDPNIVFGIQSAGSTVAADVGELGNHVAGTGSTTTGLSAHEINGTTSTAYAGLRVLGKINAPGNTWGTNVLLEVQVYEHEYSPTNEATTPGV